MGQQEVQSSATRGHRRSSQRRPSRERRGCHSAGHQVARLLRRVLSQVREVQRRGAHSPARMGMEVQRRHAPRHPHPHPPSRESGGGRRTRGRGRAPEAARLGTRARARRVRDRGGSRLRSRPRTPSPQPRAVISTLPPCLNLYR